jgi:hypothetical protein
LASSPKRRRRALKARARQRPRHDVRSEYRKGDLPVEHIAVTTIEDPLAPAAYLDSEGNLSADARLAPAVHHDGTIAEGKPGWTPPRRPTMTVIRALRNDPLGRMFARRQIDQAQYQAARQYQETADRATLGAVRSVDLAKTKVSGGIAPDMLTPSKQHAMARLRRAEQRVTDRYGAEGLGLCRAVLTEGQSVEASARLRGAVSDRDVWFWAKLFRRCLDVLAAAFGFATSTYRPPRLNGYDGHDPAEDPGRYADAGDLADLRLRRGRANGGG